MGTMEDAERFIDAWGNRPDEWFVVARDTHRGIVGLAKTPGGKTLRVTAIEGLEYPDGQRSFGGIGDMIRWSAPEETVKEPP